MSKRYNEHMKMSEVLKEFVEANKLQTGLDKVNVKQAWKDIMGNGVNSYTEKVLLKRDVLYVHLSSAVLREELSYGKEKIITLMNEALGKDLIKKLVLS